MSNPQFFNPQQGVPQQQPIPGASAPTSGPYARSNVHSNVPQQPPQYQQQQQQQQPAFNNNQQQNFAPNNQQQFVPNNNVNNNNNNAQQSTSPMFADTPLSQYVESPLAQMGASYAQQFIGNNKYIKGSLQNYETFRQLKYYFNVNNSYVINKIRLVLFPLRHKSWKRRIHRQAEGESYLPPRDDINAPDLYIPTMAFVSYVLVVAFLMGEAWHFSPEVVGEQFSNSILALCFEAAFVKAGFYFLSNASVPLLDVISYCGYKYVGITLSVLIGFVFGSYVYYACLLATGVGMATFVVKTLRLAAPASGAGSNARNYFLLGVAALQVLLFYVLGHLVESTDSLEDIVGEITNE